jgi:hypothetical protein
MTTQLHNTGEEYIMDKLDDESFDIGLFSDSSDALTDASDINDLTTEPTGSAYARQTQTFTSADASGDWEIGTSTVSFDVSDSSETVDAYFVVVTFDSDDAGDGGTDTDHLLFTGDLSQSRDLSQIDTLNVDNISGQLT